MRRIAPLLAFAAAGCMSLEPRYVRPDPAIPASWPTGDPYLRAAEASLPAVTHRDIFRDPRLQALIGQALANNRDLMVAAANIAAARAQYRVQRAQQFPQVDAAAGVTATGDRDSAVDADYRAGVSVPNFELDLFGRLRSLSRVQLQRYFATEAASRATRLALTSDIADAWLTYAADSSLLLIARQTAANAEKSVRLTRLRLEGGIAPRTDLRQAEQVLTQAQADLARQRTAVAQDINLLQLLVGAPIDPRLLPGSIDEAAPTIAELPAGLDSYVLLRRPDVMEAEYQLRAANAQIGAARAALFPRITLTGLLGFASSALTQLFSGGAFGWQASANASYTIFQAGAGQANVRLSEAQRAAAIATYQRAIQTAFREVADALARRGTMNDELDARQRQQAAAGDTYLLTEARYREGIDNFLASLDAQRSYYSAQQLLVQTKLSAAQNRVDLYRALGGDSLLQAPTISAPAP
ncbi:MAG TPA: efflux transporter outer membrane subunit [Sphingomicrobium sp.]|nr:efflux transporter outer membrane subunit [Sphingomicrobium sp.]